MALYSKKEFAERCGMPSNRLTIYINRKKVFVEDDIIDDSHEVNKLFLTKRKVKGLVPSAENVSRQQEVAKSVSTPAAGEDSGKTKSKASGKTKDDDFLELEREQKELAIQKSKEEIELLRLRKEKLNGIVIPTELVKVIFAQHTKSILVEFNNAIDETLIILSKKAGLSRTDMVEIRKQITDELNKAAKKSIDESKKGIRNIVSEYSDTRTKGENK